MQTEHLLAGLLLLHTHKATEQTESFTHTASAYILWNHLLSTADADATHAGGN